MPRRLLALVIVSVVAAIAAHAPSIAAKQRELEPAAAVDRVFARWNETTPGCAVGVATNGRPTLERAYGMADLERGIRNTADTIFEAGSVSKQFTAAAVLLLARDGKLALDDALRTHIPELPDYGSPLTIRHMLTHTSGLRDWGAIAGIGGWPRGTRVHTHDHVLEIVSRQRALNFTPGSRYSYSNSGYNLAAILVSRVSGVPFAEFTRRRIFEPLRMNDTSWRDDHTRVVKRRALAYSDEPDGFHISMPFENVHGNGGLLTTVGDLMKWNENFVAPRVGDAAFVAEQQKAGLLSNGRSHGYALGLSVGTYKGLPEVGHSGSTAGYSAHLVRFPEQRVSVGVLCNANSAQATRSAREVAEVFLAGQLKPAAPTSPRHTLTSAEAAAIEGFYRNTATGAPMRLVQDEKRLRIERGPVVTATSPTTLVSEIGHTLDLDDRGVLRVTDPHGHVESYERASANPPTADQLRELAGTYASEEAAITVIIDIDETALVLKRALDTRVTLTTLYADTFRAPQIGTIVFRRDAAGRPTGFSVIQDRVWDLRFTRRGSQGTQ